MKTKMITKAGWLSFVILLTFLVQTASAVPTAPLLPESSYAEAEDNWQGSTFFDEVWNDGFLRGRIDFAVYDTSIMQSGSEEKTLADNLALPGRFIYAYQVINDYDASDEAVAYFSIFGDGQLPLGLYEESIGSYDDESNGKAPTSYLFESQLSVVWEFTGGLLFKGDHSWFLVLSSNSGPVVGNYEIKGPESQPPPIPSEIPEPATVVLLGFGAALIVSIRKRRSSHR